MVFRVEPPHHDMAALHHADLRRRVRPQHGLQHLPHPRPGGVHQRARLDHLRLSAVMLRGHAPQAVHALGAGAPRAGGDDGAALRRVAGVQQHHARIFDPAIRILERHLVFGLEHPARRVAVQPLGARGRQALAAAQVVIQEQAQPQQPGRAQPLVMRQHEAQRPDDVRRDPPNRLAFQQGLAHQPELPVFEVAQPAMHQLGGGGRGRGGQVIGLAQIDRPAPPDGVARDAAAVDAAADDGEVENVRGGRLGHG